MAQEHEAFRDPRPIADRRDRAAERRDDAAEARDVVSDERDEVAGAREQAARRREVDALDDVDELAGRLERLREQIVARLRRIEDDAVEPPQWEGLDVAALTRLRRDAAGQRRLAAQDRVAVEALITELVVALSGVRRNRHSTGTDRDEAMRDRHAAAGDRDASADDRGQAVIEREQVDHRSGSEAARVMTEAVRAAAQPLPEEVTRAIADSRERIDSSRDLLDGSDQGGPRDDTPPDARPQSPGSPGPRGGSGERHRPEADGGGQRS